MELLSLAIRWAWSSFGMPEHVHNCTPSRHTAQMSFAWLLVPYVSSLHRGVDNSSYLGRENCIHGRGGSKNCPVLPSQDEQRPWIHFFPMDTIYLEENALARCPCTCHLAALYTSPCCLQTPVPHRRCPCSCLRWTRYGPRLHSGCIAVEHCSQGRQPSRNQPRGDL